MPRACTRARRASSQRGGNGDTTAGRPWIRSTEAPFGELGGQLADAGQATIAGVEQTTRVGGLPDHGEVEFAGPGCGRYRRRLVPVIGGLVKHQLRPAAGQVADEAIRCFLQGCPVQEMRVRLEGGTVVVQEMQPGAARIHDEAVVAVALQGTVRKRLHVLQVGRKQLVDGIRHGLRPWVRNPRS